MRITPGGTSVEWLDAPELALYCDCLNDYESNGLTSCLLQIKEAEIQVQSGKTKLASATTELESVR